MPRDHGVIFSGPMVRAILEGRKTQTRRLATSPLRRVWPDDRLWVRENFFQFGGPIAYAADEGQPTFPRKCTPSIHMPRWASRITLIAERARHQRLHDITGEDAQAEGVERIVGQGWVDYFDSLKRPLAMTARESFASLWISLHGRDSWAANPEVVAISFRVEERNIDQGRAV